VTLLAPGRYGLDDLRIGDHWQTGTREISGGMIDAFADLSEDRFEIHMSDAAAQRHGFPGRVAHGLLVLSVIDGLKNAAPVQLAAVASLGWDWSFQRPVFVGAVLMARIQVTALRPVSDGERGVATLAFDVTDNTGETVQRGTNKLMMYRAS